MKILFFVSCVFLSAANVFGQSFEIYVSDAGAFSEPPWKILKFDENGENPEVFILANLSWPQDIVFLENEQSQLARNRCQLTLFISIQSIIFLWLEDDA